MALFFFNLSGVDFINCLRLAPIFRLDAIFSALGQTYMLVTSFSKVGRRHRAQIDRAISMICTMCPTFKKSTLVTLTIWVFGKINNNEIRFFCRKRKTSKSLQRPSRTRLTRSAKRPRRICLRWTFTSGMVRPARRTTPCTMTKNETGSACHPLCQTSFRSENLTKIEQRPGKYSFSGHSFCLTNKFSVRYLN